MIVKLDDEMVRAFVDWARLQARCTPDRPLGQITRLLELQIGRDSIERKREALLAVGPPRNRCPGCFQAIHDLAEDGWCLDCKHKKPLYEKWWNESHKRMTLEEYLEMNIVGWHKVCKNIDGIGGIGVQYLPQTSTHEPIVRPGKERRQGSKPLPSSPKPDVQPGPGRPPRNCETTVIPLTDLDPNQEDIRNAISLLPELLDPAISEPKWREILAIIRELLMPSLMGPIHIRKPRRHR